MSRNGADSGQQAKLEHDLRGVVRGTVDIGSRLAQSDPHLQPRPPSGRCRCPPRLEVLVSNEASASTTMIDVRAPDAIAVLYRLAAKLTARGLDIRSAKVATLGHEVVDVFYVQQPGDDGGALQIEASQHDDLRNRLEGLTRRIVTAVATQSFVIRRDS